VVGGRSRHPYHHGGTGRLPLGDRPPPATPPEGAPHRLPLATHPGSTPDL